MDENIILVTARESGERIDALLARTVEGLSRSAAQKLLEDGCVTMAGAPLRKNYKCTAGDCFVLRLPRLRKRPLLLRTSRLMSSTRMRI